MGVNGASGFDGFNQTRVDSLKAELNKASTPKAKATLVIQISREKNKGPDKEKEIARDYLIKDNKAFNDGANVYRMLVGYTDSDEQKKVSEKIKHQEPHTIYGFIDGYERERDNGARTGNHFFTQMKREYFFDGKDELIRHVAKQLKEHFSGSGIQKFDKVSASIGEILKHKEITSEDALKLDKIIYGIRFNEANDQSSRGLIPDFENS